MKLIQFVSFLVNPSQAFVVPFIDAVVAVAGSMIGDMMDDTDDKMAGAAEGQAQAALMQSQLGKDQWDYYLDTYRPLESGLVETAAQGVDVQDRVNKASTDVTQAFAGQREAQARDMARYGIDPGSAKFQSAQMTYGLNEALAQAGAQNQARTQASQDDWARKVDAMSLGKGLPAQASSMLGAAQSGYGAAANTYGIAGNTAAQQQAGGAQLASDMYYGITGAPTQTTTTNGLNNTYTGTQGSMPQQNINAGTWDNPGDWFA